MLGIVRIRPLWLLTVGLYRAGGYEPPLQFRRGAVGIRPTRFIILGLYRTGGWAIVVAWHAETLPGTAQESQITHQPGAHWGEAPCASNYNLKDKQT